MSLTSARNSFLHSPAAHSGKAIVVRSVPPPAPVPEPERETVYGDERAVIAFVMYRSAARYRRDDPAEGLHFTHHRNVSGGELRIFIRGQDIHELCGKLKRDKTIVIKARPRVIRTTRDGAPDIYLDLTIMREDAEVTRELKIHADKPPEWRPRQIKRIELPQSNGGTLEISWPDIV